MAKKRRRSSTSGLSGAEKQEQRQKRLDEKRQARAEAVEKQRKQEQRERFVRFALLALLFVGAIWFLFLRNKVPSEFGGHQVLASSQSGVGSHTTDPVQYDTTPPVAGAHNPSPAPCGVHGEQIPNENMVHTLEHGAVGLLYDPALEADQVKALEGVVVDYNDHVFSEPFEGMDSPIVIVAWGYRMPLDTVDVDAINEFIDQFRNAGPEDIACPNDEDSPFQGGTATPSPAASPSPEETSDGGGDNDGAGNNDGGGKKGTPSGDEE